MLILLIFRGFITFHLYFKIYEKIKRAKITRTTTKSPGNILSREFDIAIAVNFINT